MGVEGLKKKVTIEVKGKLFVKRVGLRWLSTFL